MPVKENSSRLGKFIRQTRIRKNISQAELARIARISNRTISSLETGKKDHGLSARALAKLCHALQVEQPDREQWFSLVGLPAPTDEEVEYAAAAMGVREPAAEVAFSQLHVLQARSETIISQLQALEARVDTLEKTVQKIRSLERLLGVVEKLSGALAHASGS